MTPRTLPLLLLATLAGCGQMDTDTAFEPYARAGTWTAEGVNQSNLAAQLVDPLDIVRGRGDGAPHYKQSTQAVTTLWSARPTQTPQLKRARTAEAYAGSASEWRRGDGTSGVTTVPAPSGTHTPGATAGRAAAGSDREWRAAV